MDDVYYSYSLLGQRLRAAWDRLHKKNGIQYAYNVFGELQTETSNSYGDYKTVYSLEYGYDNNGNRTSIKYPDGKTFDYEYDNLNRLINIDDPDDNTLLNPVYRNNGSLSSIKRPNNANTSFAVDSLLRIEQMKHNLSGNENDVTFNYAYNPAGQIKSLKLNNKKFEATQGPVEESYITNGLNQYSKVGSKSISYHTDGNLKDDGDNTYKYDVENRLITANTERITVTLKYDPLGRLAEYREGGTTRYFVYSGNALIAEYTTKHKMNARYVHSVGADVPVVRYDTASTAVVNRRFLHANHQGSIVAVSKSDGNVYQINTYDEYGVPYWSNQTRFA
ncbi:hypothetical protein ACFO4O_14655 [Glaciecola siphonariae]|uniref:Teneurin-like YD-shell domain-containing protein n=1 Tax=Glaciecola siphonariae TaxID=521012 RepID=A0ABV9LXW2_9ALTE